MIFVHCIHLIHNKDTDSWKSPKTNRWMRLKNILESLKHKLYSTKDYEAKTVLVSKYAMHTYAIYA